MGYRGRLINPFLAEIERIDTAATTYDPVWKEPVVSYTNGVRSKATAYSAPIRLRCQYEDGAFREQRQTASGNTPATRCALVFHLRDLEAAALIDPNGLPMLRVNDRLIAVYRLDGALVQRFEPKVYAIEVQPRSFGLGGERNLVLMRFADRAEGT